MLTHPRQSTHPGPLMLVDVKRHTIWFDLGLSTQKPLTRMLRQKIGEYPSLEAYAAAPYLRSIRFWGKVRRISWVNFGALSHPDAGFTDNPNQEGLMLLDAFGDPVAVPAILGAIEAALHQARQIDLLPGHCFRSGKPAPGAGRKARGGSYYRKPMTLPEMRQNSADVVDYRGTKLGGRRRHLPTSWDDIWVGSTRSWKEYRATQWRANSF